MAGVCSPLPYCGDGQKLVGKEACDGVEGCSDSCQPLEGFLCADSFNEANECTQVSSDGSCGDGIIQAGEQCDFGPTDQWPSEYSNGRSGGCDEFCQIRIGWDCDDQTCVTQCGDGHVTEDEECDLGPLASSEGCLDCQVTEGWACSCSSCSPICGDGLLAGDEQCDDLNTSGLDGCSSICVKEDGWTCEDPTETDPSFCTEVCGDTMRVGEEQCDDGNLDAEDGCSPTCQIEPGFLLTSTCGDGVLAVGAEQCDPGFEGSLNLDGCHPGLCVPNDGFECTVSEDNLSQECAWTNCGNDI